MRRLIKKWGEAALAVLCVLAIVFAALYTRQDDLRRLAARNAAASQDERLDEARQAPDFQPPVDGARASDFPGAARTPGGLWRLDPWICYDTVPGQAVCAMGAGQVTESAEDAVVIEHGNGLRTRYRALSFLRVQAGDSVEAGQRIGAAKDHQVYVCAQRNGAYIDPVGLYGQ